MTELQRGKAVTVERGHSRSRSGQGVFKAMAVVWKHWQGSFRKNVSFEQIHGTFTAEYPEERPRLPQTYRNMPILLFDDETGQELCTSCFQCQRICPPQVIHMTQAKDPASGKAVPSVAEFIIEYDACMSCGFCAEVCPFDAIKMDQDFELSTAHHQGLTVRKEQLNRPVSYYEKIAPDLWAGVKESAYKKLQGNIKRRPGMIGVAPQVAERVRAMGQAAEAAAPAPAPPSPAPAAPAAPAEAKKLTPEEKAARLAAIRAANVAKEGSAPPAAEPPAPAAPADEKAAKLAAIRAANAARKTDGPQPVQAAVPAAEPPADEKAAKLAAIRAANAAKKATAEGAPAVEPGTTPSPPPAAPPPAVGEPSDEKAARLAAIRAANAAKKAREESE